jgi:uncharacterized protein YndB with AHSA1/START domain
MTMTQNKDLKRLVRARMKKTGESYTSARAQLLSKSQKKSRAVKIDYAALAGMSDEAIKAKTGCTWERWVKSLDYYGADKMSHAEIARLVSDKWKVGSWWRQTVAVGYERIKGLRARGQRRDGSYEATKSRTFNVPVEKLFDAWRDTDSREQWLDGTSVKVRTATRPKSMWLDWGDGSIIAVGFTSKGKSKSQLAVSHTKLPDRDAANRVKGFWSEKFDDLKKVLNE